MSNYTYYRTILDQQADQCSAEQLSVIKESYKDVINSRRRLESISSLRDLIRILEKRDYLNVNRTELLLNIARKLNIVLPPVVEHNQNGNIFMNGLNNHQHIEIQRRVLPSVPTNLKERIYQCIAFDIGQKWSDLARALNVPEGYIDELGRRLEKTSNRVDEVLRYHEEQCDPRMWRSSLLDALTDARRNDLRKKVQYIFDTHS